MNGMLSKFDPMIHYLGYDLLFFNFYSTYLSKKKRFIKMIFK